MTAHILALTHGFLGFELAFALMAVSTYAGLIRHRAHWTHYYRWPLPGIVIMLICALIFWLLFGWMPGADTAIVGILRILVGLVLFPLFGYTLGETLAEDEASPPPEHRRGTVVSRAAPRPPAARPASRSPVSRSPRRTRPSTSS